MLPFSPPRSGPVPALTVRPWLVRLRRFGLRRRRLLAALLCCAAAGTAVQALLPPEAQTVSLIVTAADLPAGALLGAGDLRTVAVSASAAPPDSFATADQLSGRRLATPLKQGSPVMLTSLVGSGLLTGAPPGTVAVSVRPADPAIVQLLSPGQRVDVVLGSSDGMPGESVTPAVLASDAPVLWTAPDGASSWPGTGDGGAAVVLAAAPDEAAALAAASGTGLIHLVLTGG